MNIAMKVRYTILHCLLFLEKRIIFCFVNDNFMLCTVITCTESLHATIILQEKRSTIDLVLMEVHMPKMDGYEFLLANQEIDVPIIST